MSKLPPRHPQWEQRLHELVAASFHMPHAFGSNDCLIFPANAAKAVIGKDHAQGHRGKYRSLAGAYRYLKTNLGAQTPEALLDRLFPQKKIGFAALGDLVLCRIAAGEGLAGIISGDVPGLCCGDFALVVGETGLERVPRGALWLKAWAVGEHHSGPEAMA